MERRPWQTTDVELLETYYSEHTKIKDIAEKLDRSVYAVKAKILELGLCDKYMHKNNINFKAPYQEYEWCYERYIVQGKNMHEMAEEAGTKFRTIQKWCSEKFGMNEVTFSHIKKLNDIQKQIIIAGTLGDGHITKNESLPVYIESHAEGEKEYLFWKYSFLKDICTQPPAYKEPRLRKFSNGKEYSCSGEYRMSTRSLDEFNEIRNTPLINRIASFNDFQLSILLLDDGNRNDLWELCVAERTPEEIQCLGDKFKEYHIQMRLHKDIRYVYFDALSSKRIDEMILKNIPNDLDIIKKKITENQKIKPYHHNTYIICGDDKIGLSQYCKDNHINLSLKIIKDEQI